MSMFEEEEYVDAEEENVHIQADLKEEEHFHAKADDLLRNGFI